MTITQFLTARLDEREKRYSVGEFENVDSVRGPDWGVRTCPICHEHGWEGSPDVTEEAAYKHLPVSYTHLTLPTILLV